MKISMLTFLLHLFSFLAEFHLLTASDYISSRYKCPTTCDEVEINYPFGVGTGCYLLGYELACSNDILYIPGPVNLQVLEIMQGEIRVNTSSFVAVYCPSVMTSFQNVVSITLNEYMPYTFSDQAKFIAIGCNTNALIKGYDRGKGNQCFSTCEDANSTINNTCTGLGCCEISLPPVKKQISFFVKSYSEDNNMPCSYAFIAEEWKFDFKLSRRPVRTNNWNITMKLEWAVGESSCTKAVSSKGYVCGGNTTCVDSNRGSGYLCKCLDGYEGNPYLNGSQECRDIDECSESPYSQCAPEATCKNQIPGYTCQCPPGSSGSGLIGQGCRKRLQVILASVASILVFGTTALFSAWCYCAWKERHLRAMYFQQNGGLLLNQYFRGTPVNETRIFTATELKKATNNYNGKGILGRGGHGTVYKGILSDGTVVAIKKSQEVDQRHVNQFINELIILARVKHKNIVKLLGCCLETEVPLVVYEFIPNGTLDQTLHDCVKDSNHMPWKDRIRVAKEIAEALSYLHNHKTMTIVHRDVKSSNILLDDNHAVKLADFGISRLVSLDKARVSTAVRGTIGYLDPEYFKTGKLTQKSDVYSYGVVLLELLTSLKPIRHEPVRDYSSLVIHFMSYAGESNIMGIFEEETLKRNKFEELYALAEIARSCLAMKGEERPTMKKVIKDLAELTGGTLNINVPSDKECT